MREFREIADYDFASDVSVTVLGHIFEQSVSDIEAMRAQRRALSRQRRRSASAMA